MLRIGDAVRVRRQRWRIAGITAGEGCDVLTLIGTGVTNSGLERRVLTPFDIVEPSTPSGAVHVVSLRRWRAACRRWLAAAGSPAALRAAARARIDLHPYQLEAAIAIVTGLGSRVLIADEVGLGKTIQASLVVAELRARGAADRVLVLSPAGLRDQWAGELRERFGLEAVVMDMNEGRRRAQSLPVGRNPWSTIPIAISSIDYVKRPEVLSAVRESRWDAIVIDEAHGVVRGSDRHEAAAVLSASAAYVVLLTATPHSGDEPAFRSLCALGAHGPDPLLVLRRSRRDVALGPGRRVHRLHVRTTNEEARMLAVLAEFTRAVRGDRAAVHDREAWLVLTILHKRALSSAYSLGQTVSRRLTSLQPGAPGVERQFALPLDDPSGELDPSDEAPEWRTALMSNDAERRLLSRMLESAHLAVPHQAKVLRLRRLLARLARLGERAVVFTEYRDTLLHIRDALQCPAAVIHGGMTGEERRAAIQSFVDGPLGLLLATDAAGEGLNLQRNCRIVINLELPWNPMRLEQRIGRVDRIGQQRRVHVFHLVARHTGEARVLDRLKARLMQARSAVGAPDPLGLFDANTEEAIARRIVGGGPRPDVGEGAATRELADAGSTIVVRLGPEAAAEHERLTQVRSVDDIRDRQPPSLSGDVLVAFPRRRALRLRLSTRILAIVAAALEDDDGRAAAVHLTALLLTVPSADVGGRVAASKALADLRSLDLEAIDPAFASWQREAARAHRAFWDARLSRERAAAHFVVHRNARFVQAGLFDRRADRAGLLDDCRQRALRDEAVQRLAAAERRLTVRTKPWCGVLMLMPHATFGRHED